MKVSRRMFAASAPAAIVGAAITPPATAAGALNVARSRGGLLGAIAGRDAETSGPSDTWGKAWNAFHEAMKEHRDADEVREAFRNTVGMDADLYALKSIPPQQKALMQMRRDQERRRERLTLEQRIKEGIAKQFGVNVDHM